jgi:glycosyltransferase involved in cell wall biosynthesis
MIGTRGVPATFGGVERHVEELGSRLVDRGFAVTVYCRTNYGSDVVSEHRGMAVCRLPTLATKHGDAIVHSFISTVHAMSRRHDILHFHAVGPGLVAPLPRYLSRARVVQTIHGLDGERAKWNVGARRVLDVAERCSARVPDATIVVSESLREHYVTRYGSRPDVIVNGVDDRMRPAAQQITARFGLHRGSYLLFVGRLVPEKAPHLLVEAFRTLETDQSLVIVGDSSFSDDYLAHLTLSIGGDPRIRLVGFTYGRLLDELFANATAFVLPSDVEGMPLTLLEALASGTPVVVSDIAPHREVVGADGPGHRLFSAGSAASLVAALRRSLDDPDLERAGAADLCPTIRRRYDWDVAAAAVASVYRRVAG